MPQNKHGIQTEIANNSHVNFSSQINVDVNQLITYRFSRQLMYLAKSTKAKNQFNEETFTYIMSQNSKFLCG